MHVTSKSPVSLPPDLKPNGIWNFDLSSEEVYDLTAKKF